MPLIAKLLNNYTQTLILWDKNCTQSKIFHKQTNWTDKFKLELLCIWTDRKLNKW